MTTTVEQIQATLEAVLGVTRFSLNQEPERLPDVVTSVGAIHPPKLQQAQATTVTLDWRVTVTYRLGQYQYHDLPLDTFIQYYLAFAAAFDGNSPQCGLTYVGENQPQDFLMVTQERLGENFEGYYYIDLSWNLTQLKPIFDPARETSLLPKLDMVTSGLFRSDIPLNTESAILDKELTLS